MFPAEKLHINRHESSVKDFKVVKAIHSITYLNEAVSTSIQDLPTPSSPEQYTATVILNTPSSTRTNTAPHTHTCTRARAHTHEYRQAQDIAPSRPNSIN